MTTVVNLRTEGFDVYIGRGKCPKTGAAGIWGNPFHIGDVYGGRVMSRSMAIDQFEDWLNNSEDGLRLKENIWQLYGKRLGCFCKPESCHGDVLASIADMYPPILEFKGSYEFLSNFHGGAFSLEHDYQAAKARNKTDAWFIQNSPKPAEAKRRGKMIKLRDDWEEVKLDVMMGLLEKKFTLAPMAEQLLGTGYSLLVEGNWWHDNIWGSCRCDKCGDSGENLLGQMLMDIRRRLRFDELKVV